MSLEIQSILGKSVSFSDLLPIAKKAKAELSFWGCRYIVVNGYKGSLPIDTLNKCVNDMLLMRKPMGILTREERKSLIDEIDRVYEEIDVKESAANTLTTIFMELRDLLTRMKNLTFRSHLPIYRFSIYREYWDPYANKEGLRDVLLRGCRIVDRNSEEKIDCFIPLRLLVPIRE